MHHESSFVPIHVRSHSGYRAEEYPLSFVLESREYEIEEIIDRWYQGKRDPESPAADYFRVKLETGEEAIIQYDREMQRWFFVEWV